MFHWDGGLKLTRADLAVDFCRRQPRAFVSHAHSDHIARHEYTLCTPQTAALFQLRMGARRVREMHYRESIEWGGMRLTAYPAGHCLGSAMLLAEDDGRRLLYTGDFKLDESATAEKAELPRADILVIESTYGEPNYRLPPRAGVLDQLYSLVREILAQGSTPVIEAYTLGKAQEVTKLLTTAGFRVVQHADVAKVSNVYQSQGMDLGPYEVFAGRCEPDQVLIVPPRGLRQQLRNEVRIAVTGWAIDPSTKYRLRVDHAVPLSDHADYDQLFEAVDRVGPEVIYCTHGPESFVDRLCEAGHNARPLGRPTQQRLF
jgi:putative mRNA 3-end processing factor